MDGLEIADIVLEMGNGEIVYSHIDHWHGFAVVNQGTPEDMTAYFVARSTHPDDHTVVMNPRAVCEVLSPSTALRDWNEKLPKYRAMASVYTIVYVDHTQRRVTAYQRRDGGWDEAVVASGSLFLDALGVELDVDALYDAGLDDGGP